MQVPVNAWIHKGIFDASDFVLDGDGTESLFILGDHPPNQRPREQYLWPAEWQRDGTDESMFAILNTTSAVYPQIWAMKLTLWYASFIVVGVFQMLEIWCQI